MYPQSDLTNDAFRKKIFCWPVLLVVEKFLTPGSIIELAQGRNYGGGEQKRAAPPKQKFCPLKFPACPPKVLFCCEKATFFWKATEN